jgi:hypothetical protein
MSNKLGPIDLVCDAPQLAIVKACERLGFRSPMDVRWQRLSQFFAEREKQQETQGHSLWRWIVRGGQASRNACSCGEPLPILEWYTFTFISGQLVYCSLAQCPRCRTIFWEDA